MDILPPTAACPPPAFTDESVLKLLLARKGEWQTVAKASGISYSWLSKFCNGHIPNPGYATLRQLHTYLTQETAEAA